MEVLEKIKKLAKNIYKEFIQGNPKIELVARGTLKSIEYDEKRDLILLKKSKFLREFFNLKHSRKFMQTLLVARLAKELLERNKHASLREVYYQLKHTIPYVNENTFEEQNESDAIIEDLERSLEIIREQMHITAKKKGALYGDVTLRDKNRGDEWNCSKLGYGGWSIPSTVEPDELEIVEVNADFILVVEKDALYERLIEEKFPEKQGCLLIATEGQAARGIRRLIHRFRYEYKLPIIVFTDGDPWGFYIYSVIKRGSMKLSHFSEKLATPDAKFVGMTMDDVEEYDLKNVTMKLKPIDEKRVRQLMDYPWFKNVEWQRQFAKMLTWKIKIEQDALASRSLEFVAEVYLPEKIENNRFLP